MGIVRLWGATAMVVGLVALSGGCGSSANAGPEAARLNAILAGTRPIATGLHGGDCGLITIARAEQAVRTMYPHARLVSVEPDISGGIATCDFQTDDLQGVRMTVSGQIATPRTVATNAHAGTTIAHAIDQDMVIATPGVHHGAAIRVCTTLASGPLPCHYIVGISADVTYVAELAGHRPPVRAHTAAFLAALARFGRATLTGP